MSSEEISLHVNEMLILQNHMIITHLSKMSNDAGLAFSDEFKKLVNLEKEAFQTWLGKYLE